VVVHRGRLIHERYDNALVNWEGPDIPVDRDTQLLSWSMAKSILHAAVGVLVGDGALDVDAPAGIAEWSGDERAAITLDHLLCMRDGLSFNEDYVDGETSDVIEMLFASGRDDVAGYATARPLGHEPGTRFNYSSGTSNIVSSIVAGVVGRGDSYEQFLRTRLLERIGVSNFRLGVDATGLWVGSTFLYTPAREFAKFGLLYLRDGVWDGERILPERWVDHGRRFRSVDEADGRKYGAHWWVTDDDLGTWWASGYDGQSILLCPALDLIVVRLGSSPDPEGGPSLFDWRRRVVEAFRDA
jgi:CubicO group peptidase (beta-lactamase class C family)